MYQVMVAGAGNIGSLIACLLANSGDYQVYLADLSFAKNDTIRLLKAIPGITTVVLDVQDHEAVQAYLKKKEIIAVISSLPYYLTASLAQSARIAQVHYFDLTEDIAVTTAVKRIADGAPSAFVPQCGLAPGIVSIIANSMMQRFVRCDQAKLRVGALPQRSSQALHYSLTWSTDGMINEYGNVCYGIEQGKLVSYAPLEGLEAVQLDGKLYEAFNTSGGLGSLTELYEGRIQTLTYKTLRYPGHCDKMRLLMNDLKLNDDRAVLKHILENAIPRTYQDVVIIYVSVEGIQDGVFLEENYFKKIYPKLINEIKWSAIQIATASGVCAVADCVLTKADDYHGLILQEKLSFSDILANRFGGFYAPE